MKVVAIKTRVVKAHDDLYAFLDEYIISLSEKSVVVVTSKIVALAQGRVLPTIGVDKDTLIASESQYFLPRETNAYGLFFTVTNNILVVNAGIDESNADGNYILWPENPQQVANEIREYLCKKFGIRFLGVILSDSKTSPMRWGVTGISLAQSGFVGVNNLIGTPDIFGKALEVTTVSVMDSLASAAVVVMGEANEQQPLAVITELPDSVVFQDSNPTQEELNNVRITLDEDMYGVFLKNAPWKKGITTSE